MLPTSADRTFFFSALEEVTILGVFFFTASKAVDTVSSFFWPALPEPASTLENADMLFPKTIQTARKPAVLLFTNRFISLFISLLLTLFYFLFCLQELRYRLPEVLLRPPL